MSVSTSFPIAVSNQLLAVLPYKEYKRLLPHWEYVSLSFKQVLYAPGESIDTFTSPIAV